MFKIPPKDIIINKDSQVRLLEDDGTPYADNDVTPTTGGIILEGFLSLTMATQFELLKAATRIIKDTPVAGVAEIAAYTVGSTASVAGDVFRLVMKSLDLTPVEMQNVNLEKRYQMSSDKSSAATIAAHIAATINADSRSLVTAYAGFNNVTPGQDDSAKVVLVAKVPGMSIELFSNKITLTKVAAGTTVYHTAEDTSAVTANPTLPVNTYDSLKNVNWAKNFDFDRNVEWMPAQGGSYNSYYFVINDTGMVGAQNVSAGKNLDVQTAYRLYVQTGTTLATAMDLLVGDLNA
jgi:hypothetical protein